MQYIKAELMDECQHFVSKIAPKKTQNKGSAACAAQKAADKAREAQQKRNLFSLGLLPTKSLSRNKKGCIQYGCENVGDQPVAIQKGADLGKFTCLTDEHEDVVIPEDSVFEQEGFEVSDCSP